MKSALSGVKKVKPHAYRKHVIIPHSKGKLHSEKLFFSMFVLLIRRNHYIIFSAFLFPKWHVSQLKHCIKGLVSLIRGLFKCTNPTKRNSNHPKHLFTFS